MPRPLVRDRSRSYRRDGSFSATGCGEPVARTPVACDVNGVTGSRRFTIGILQLLTQQLEEQIKSVGPLEKVERVILHTASTDLARLCEKSSSLASCSASSILAGDQPTGDVSQTVSERVNYGDLVTLPRSHQGVPADEAASHRIGDMPSDAKRLIAVFPAIDRDQDGLVTAEELRQALVDAGCPAARSNALMRAADADGNGTIDYKEWTKAVETSVTYEFLELSRKFACARRTQFKPLKVSSHSCMLAPGCWFRVLWDVMIACLLFYVMMMMPFVLAFGHQLKPRTTWVLASVDAIINSIFIFDMLLNFRTGFFTREIDVGYCMDPCRVATQYLRSWFLIDLISSFPFDYILAGEGTAQLTLLKVLKLGKVSRVFKLVASSDGMGSALRSSAEIVEDALDAAKLRMVQKRWGVLVALCMTCHWMACCLSLSGPGFLDSYQDVSRSAFTSYVAALYWSMTTLTTVGYGDIIPYSEVERIFAMLAMVVGGAFYGYMIGNISSMVANHDLNANAYDERVELIHAWMDHHKLPWQVRRKLKRHFRAFWAERSAFDESEIYDNISPDLRNEICSYVIDDEVMANPLFDGLPRDVVVRLMKILQKVVVPADQPITKCGEVGLAMYIITQGKVKLEFPDQVGSIQLGKGDSFGEEIILSLDDWYRYDATALTDVKLQVIKEDKFQDLFRSMPDIMEKLNASAAEIIATMRSKL